MFGSVSGVSYAPYSYFRTNNTQQASSANTYAAPQAERSFTPVQPVPAAREVISNDAKFSTEALLQQHASDPAGMAMRMRIQYPAQQSGLPQAEGFGKAESAQEVFGEGECQTCAQRKYQDGSDDPGVSFKTPTNLTPDEAATAVRSHEMEHVVREQAQASRENREVVSQNVTIHTAICPECGTVYASGGTTTTVTRAKSDNNTQQNPQQNHTPFSAVA